MFEATPYSATEAPVAQFNSLGDEIGNSEWDRETWLAWCESEFAGYQREREDNLVADDAGETEERQALLDSGLPLEEVDRWCPGPIEVPKHRLEADRDTLRWLQRSGGNQKVRFQRDGRWVTRNLPGTRRNAEMLREGPNDTAVVIGAHPFSTDEGAAEWLQRTRLELRAAYIDAARRGDDRACKAIVAREAALRARHNARCFARAAARYYEVDENLALSLLDLYQRLAPIGWLGIETEMREAFVAAQRHFEDATARWDAAFDPKWSQVEKDEWLDRMPVAPAHPTTLVSSVKKLRRYTQVPVGNSLPEADVKTRTTKRGERPAPRSTGALRQAVAEQRARRTTRVPAGWLRFVARESETEWYATRKEFERAECIEPVRLSVPEDYPCDWRWGDITGFPTAA